VTASGFRPSRRPRCPAWWPARARCSVQKTGPGRAQCRGWIRTSLLESAWLCELRCGAVRDHPICGVQQRMRLAPANCSEKRPTVVLLQGNGKFVEKPKPDLRRRACLIFSVFLFVPCATPPSVQKDNCSGGYNQGPLIRVDDRVGLPGVVQQPGGRKLALGGYVH